MKPITVTTTVERPREELFDLLADLRDHEPFTDHMLVEWSGTAERVRVRSAVPGRADWLDIQTLELERPRILAPLLRPWLRRVKEKAMRRLKEHVEGGVAAS